MVRAGVKYYRRLLSILLALVVAVALMVSVSVPAYASIGAFHNVDYSTKFLFPANGNAIYRYDSDTSDFDDRVAYPSRELVSSTVYNPIYTVDPSWFEDGDRFRLQTTFEFIDPLSVQDVLGADCLYFRLFIPFGYRDGSVDFLSNSDKFPNVLTVSGYDVNGKSVSYGYSDYTGVSTGFYHNLSISLPISDLRLINSISFDFYFEYVADESIVSDFFFEFGQIQLFNIDSSAYQKFIYDSFSSLLTEEQKQSGYLEQFVSLVTSGNAKLDQIISIIQTVNSSNATVAEKIEAGNQLQQIQNNLIQGDVNATTPDVIVDADVQAGDLSSAEDAIYSELGEIDFSIFDPDIMFSPVVPGFAFAGLIYKKIFDIPIVYTVTFAALILGLACAIIGRTVGRD